MQPMRRHDFWYTAICTVAPIHCSSPRNRNWNRNDSHRCCNNCYLDLVALSLVPLDWGRCRSHVKNSLTIQPRVCARRIDGLILRFVVNVKIWDLTVHRWQVVDRHVLFDPHRAILLCHIRRVDLNSQLGLWVASMLAYPKLLTASYCLSIVAVYHCN